MQIIDIHTHAFPDDLAPRALAVLEGNSKVSPNTNGTCGGLCDSMQTAGIDRAALMTIATKPEQARSINRWAAAAGQQYETLIPFGSLHPMQEDCEEEIERIAADGIVGVKFHADYQQFYVDDPAAIPMYRALADAKIVVLFHAGVDIGLPPPVHCTPDRLACVLDAVPDLTVIAAHMGGYRCWDDVERYLVGRDLYFDTSYSLTDLGLERMYSLICAHGVDRILFGTDSPWTNQSVEVAGIRALPFAENEIEAIMGGNARRLLS